MTYSPTITYKQLQHMSRIQRATEAVADIMRQDMLPRENGQTKEPGLIEGAVLGTAVFMVMGFVWLACVAVA